MIWLKRFAAVFAICAPLAAHGATLQVNGAGQLIGATGVDVDGALWDVVFSGGEWDFSTGTGLPATTKASADLFSQALLGQVFIDTVLGNFDSAPETTNGCENENSCLIFTPYLVDGSSTTFSVAFNQQAGGTQDDMVRDLPVTLGLTGDFADATTRTLAVWTPSEVAEPPDVEICALITLNADMVSGFSDADNVVDDSCEALPQGIPIGLVGGVDGTYRFRVSNTGPEKLVNVRINAPDFGLDNAPIPCNAGMLDVNDVCIINFGDPGFPSLKVFDVCVAPGSVNKIATVDGEGDGSGIPVSDDDPAIVDCVAEPAIDLKKQVSLDGGPFLDADTPATGPSGVIGDDAEYRFIVENTGTETLISPVITDPTLGLINVPVPGGPLAPSDVRVVDQGDAGFGPLLYIDRCDSIGNKLNIARVDAEGELTGSPVGDDDLANVTCEIPQIELLKQVSVDGGANFFDADNPGDPDVPVGIVDQTDALYRLIVRNIGTEILTNVLVEDATLGISQFISDLGIGETRILEQGDAGFGNLYVPMRCGGTPGNKSNIASVAAIGDSTGEPVGDDDPANMRCIVGPAIELLKQVSLDGTTFEDADSAATGPTGLLGADATYRLIVRNVGDDDLTNVTLDDTTLGIVGEVIPDLPIGGEVVIDVGSFGKFQELFFPNRCDSVGTKLNIAEVHANGSTTGTPVTNDNPAYVNCEVPLACEIEVDKTCRVKPPIDDALCTDSVSASTLRYTGPSISNADVIFSGKDNGLAEYTGIDLVSGVTVLTMASQNDYTISAGVGEKLGSETTVTINGVVEIIHTSCSATYGAGAPAPLDEDTPNPPNSAKGDPSPNWLVVNFLQQDGAFVEEPGLPSPQDSCEVAANGGDVTYGYLVSNVGTTNVDVTSVFDDLLGEQLTAATMLAPGDSLNLSAGPVFIAQDTTNTVTVKANVAGDAAVTCLAADSTTVASPPVAANLLAVPNPSPVNVPMVITADIGDTSAGSSVIVSAAYSIDGGDSVSMAATDGDFDAPFESVTAPLPGYVSAGTHTICVTGTDALGAESEPACIVLAVYDPDGGFVTGGGWFDSPAGAYVPDASLTGKAHFGFFSRYKKGTTVPTGSTDFRFMAGGLNFYSDAYDWLVVSGGDKTAMFKGVGTINGEPDGNGNFYGFMIWAEDGEPDRLRMRIWSEDNGVETDVYDNGFNQPLGGGSIVIHTGGKKK